jgi:hypothetical protein
VCLEAALARARGPIGPPQCSDPAGGGWRYPSGACDDLSHAGPLQSAIREPLCRVRGGVGCHGDHPAGGSHKWQLPVRPSGHVAGGGRVDRRGSGRGDVSALLERAAKREPLVFKRIPYNPGRGTRGCVPRVAAAGDPTSELIELLFDLMRHGHAHFGHQLYAPLKRGARSASFHLGCGKDAPSTASARPADGSSSTCVHEAVGRKPGHEALRRHPLPRRSRRKRGRGGMGTRCRCELLHQEHACRTSQSSSLRPPSWNPRAPSCSCSGRAGAHRSTSTFAFG